MSRRHRALVGVATLSAAIGFVVATRTAAAELGPTESTTVVVNPARILDTRVGLGLSGPVCRSVSTPAGSSDVCP